MRVVKHAHAVHVVLSERNLRVLLHKLDVPRSSRTLFRDGVFVTAEQNDIHYIGRTPGIMTDETEAALASEGGKG